MLISILVFVLSYPRLLELETALCRSIDNLEKTIPPTINESHTKHCYIPLLGQLCSDGRDTIRCWNIAHGIIIQEVSGVGDGTSTDIPDSCSRTNYRSLVHTTGYRAMFHKGQGRVSSHTVYHWSIKSRDVAKAVSSGTLELWIKQHKACHFGQVGCQLQRTTQKTVIISQLLTISLLYLPQWQKMLQSRHLEIILTGIWWSQATVCHSIIWYGCC